MNAYFNLYGCVLVVLALAGCESQPAAPPAQAPSAGPASQHHDHGAGPHGGTIGEWGGGAYHIEFTVDRDKHESTVYILGGDAKSPAPIKASKLLLSIDEPSFQVDLLAQPLDGEEDGASSRFVGQHESLASAKPLTGTVTAEVEGTPYSGDFKEEAKRDK
jgi:hypothetical protein